MSDLSNPLSPTVVSTELGNPELADILSLLAKRIGLELRVCIPAKIVAVDGNQLVDVQPLLKTRYVGDAAATSMRVISQIPVSMPMGQDWAVRYPIAVGDTGYLICADRSLDVWLAGDGSEVDPSDNRTHTLQDAVFVCGLVPLAKQSVDTTTDMYLTNGQAMIRLEKSGKFRVSNSGQELVALVIQLTQVLAALTSQLQSGQIITSSGPTGFWSVTQTQLSSTLSQVQTILSNLQTLEGT